MNENSIMAEICAEIAANEARPVGERLAAAMRMLALSRAEMDSWKAKEDAAKAAYQATSEYQAYLDAQMTTAAYQQALVEREERARRFALEAYEATKNTKPVEGVQIKLYTVKTYDPAEVLSWCEENAPAFVIKSLDKNFDKVAEAMAAQGAPVEIRREPRPTLAKDLSSYLSQEEIAV